MTNIPKERILSPQYGTSVPVLEIIRYMFLANFCGRFFFKGCMTAGLPGFKQFAFYAPEQCSSFEGFRQ